MPSPPGRATRQPITECGRASPRRRSPATGNLKRIVCMTTFRRGDVVLVPFSFTDRSGSKWRPAVVVSSDQYNWQTPDVVIASVTGNLAAIRHPGDHRIQDWQTAGL